MNFMQWLNSLDELLYEVVSWIIFFPLTLWKIMRHPFTMMDYATSELTKDDADQYAETLSPPIFLILALVISHAIGIAIGGGTNPIVRSHHGLAGLINDNTTFLLFKIGLFSTFPLLLATRMARKTGRLDRNRLQPAFYAQCFDGAVRTGYRTRCRAGSASRLLGQTDRRAPRRRRRSAIYRGADRVVHAGPQSICAEGVR